MGNLVKNGFRFDVICSVKIKAIVKCPSVQLCLMKFTKCLRSTVCTVYIYIWVCTIHRKNRKISSLKSTDETPWQGSKAMDSQVSDNVKSLW